MRRSGYALTLVLLLSPTLARADAEEASLRLQVGPAIILAETPVYTSATTTRPGLAGSLALGYGLSDRWMVEVLAGTSIAQALEYPGQMTSEHGPGTIHHDHLAIHAGTAVTARFGARWVPMVRGALGYQYRLASGGAVIEDGTRNFIGPFEDQVSHDILVGAGVGLGLRLHRHWLVTVGVEATHAFALGGSGFDSFTVPVTLEYLWYPGWFARTGAERLDD
jgi:hypothetical protein